MATQDDFSSSLLGGRLLFGKYPTDEEVAILRASGYSLIVDLCPHWEITWEPYAAPPGIRRVHCPVPDRQPVGDPDEYAAAVAEVISTLQRGYKVYIHCRGGHGRSATMAAIVLGRVTGMSGQDCLVAVKEAHRGRCVVSPKMRRLGAPQTAKQKRYVVACLAE